MSRATNEACLCAHLAAENRHDMDATLAALHPDRVFVDQPLDLELTGHAGARQHYETWWPAFGSTVDGGGLHWVDDDYLIGEARFEGGGRRRQREVPTFSCDPVPVSDGTVGFPERRHFGTGAHGPVAFEALHH